MTKWRSYALSLEALDAAESEGAKRIEGFMYTTWRDPYLEYEDLGRVADLLRNAGRWVE